MSTRRGSTAPGAREQEEPRGPLTQAASLRAGPLFIWAAVQIIAIGIAETRLSLAAQYPVIGEFHATQVLLAVQMPLAAMLMRALLTQWRSTVAAAFLAGLLQFTASLLTDVTPVQAWPTVIYITLWVAATRLIAASFCESTIRLMTVAGALAAFIAGGPLLIYLGAEFSSRPLNHFLGGPLLPMLQNWPKIPAAPWGWLGILIAVAGAKHLVFQPNCLRRKTPALES